MSAATVFQLGVGRWTLGISPFFATFAFTLLAVPKALAKIFSASIRTADKKGP